MLGWFSVISEQVEGPGGVASLVHGESQEAPKASTQNKKKRGPSRSHLNLWALLSNLILIFFLFSDLWPFVH